MWMVLWLFACSDYELAKEDDADEPVPSDTEIEVSESDPTETETEVETEDTGLDCWEMSFGTYSADLDTGCDGAIRTGTFTPVVEWSVATFTDQPDFDTIHAGPVVGQLTDDDGDGDIDEDDIPDIVVSCDDNAGGADMGVIRVISGDGTSVTSWWTDTLDGTAWTVTRLSGVGLGDVDGDGAIDVLVNVSDGTDVHAASFTPDGTLQWVATEADLTNRYGYPHVADLDGDGQAEVIVGATILSGADGSVLGEGAYGIGGSTGYNHIATAFGMDLDGDGVGEVVGGNALYDPEGNALCTTGDDDGHPAAADLDGDGEGEFVVAGGGEVRVYDTDCTLLDSWRVGTGYGGPPTIADFDGDGEPEIGVAAKGLYVVSEVDGTPVWSRTNTDSSGSTGSSVFDFEGDGVAEVVYADQTTLYVLAGPDGTVRLSHATHDSGTVLDLPVVADVDNDGQAEIVVVNAGYGSFGSTTGVYVLGDKDGSWMPAATQWTQHAWFQSHIDDDGQAVAGAPPNWPDANTFRSADLEVSEVGPRPNAVPRLLETCTWECDDDLLWLAFNVENRGADDLVAGTPVAIYAIDGTATLVTVTSLPDDVPAGATSEGIVLSLDATAIRGATLQIVADDDGTGAEVVDECREDDNVLAVTDGLCD